MVKSIWYVGGSAQSYDGWLPYYGFVETMRSRSKQPVYFTYIDGHSTYLSPAIIEQINNNADLLVIGDGGFVNYRNNLEPKYNINHENISSIKVPIVGLSIEDFTVCQDADMWDSLRVFVDSAALFSVGHGYSFGILDQHNINTDKVFSAFNPAVVVKPISTHCGIFNTGRFNIGINWTSQSSNRQYESVKDIARNFDIKIYLLEHDIIGIQNQWEKLHMRESITSWLEKEEFSILYDDLGNELYPPSYHSVPLMADVYSHMDVVIGESAYSGMLAFGLGIPFFGVSDNDRMRHLTADINAEHIQDEDRTTLKYRLEEMATTKSDQNNRDMLIEQFKYSTEWFIDQILALDF